jgi:HK97 family phage portal protein
MEELKKAEILARTRAEDEEDGEVGRMKSVDFDTLTSDDVGAGMWDAEFKAFMDTITLKGLFFHEDWVFILVDMVADHIAMSPLKVYKRKMVDGREYHDELPNHSLGELLEQPNEYQEYEAWMYNYAVEYCLMGNTIQWRMKKSDQIMILPTETVMLRFGQDAALEQYVVTTTNGFAGDTISDGMTFKPKDIWHHRRPNPASLMWGLSPFIANRKALLFNRYTQDYLNSFYLKGATPGLALKMEKNVAEDSAMRFLRTFETSHTGRRNMRRTIMLPKGVDVKTITPNIGDQRLVEMINSNREKILNTLRVPKHALSLAENGSLGSEEHKVALKFFYTSAIIPLQKKIARYLTRRFREENRLRPNEFLAFCNDEVEALREDEMKRAQLGQALKEQWTLNEIRTEIHNKPPVDGGDAYPGTTGNSTQPDVPNSGTHNPPPDAAGADAKKPGAGAGAGDPKKPDKPDPADGEDQAAKAIRVAQAKIIEEGFAEQIAAHNKALDDAVDGQMEGATALWLAAIATLAEDSVRVVKKALKRVPAAVKANDGEPPAHMPPKDKLRASLEDEFGKTAEAVATQQADMLSPVAENGYTVGTKAIVNAEARDELDALRAEGEDGRKLLLKARGIKTFDGLTQDATGRVLEVVANGVEAQKTVQQITNDLVDNFTELGQSRAELIARTEVLTAASIGQAAAMDAAKEIIDDLVKVWITAGDARVRGTPGGVWKSKGNHFKLHGDVVPVDEPFDNGLRYPRDPRARIPHEVVNCRCSWLVVSAKDLGTLNIPTNFGG